MWDRKSTFGQKQESFHSKLGVYTTCQGAAERRFRVMSACELRLSNAWLASNEAIFTLPRPSIKPVSPLSLLINLSSGGSHRQKRAEWILRVTPTVKHNINNCQVGLHTWSVELNMAGLGAQAQSFSYITLISRNESTSSVTLALVEWLLWLGQNSFEKGN